MQLIMYNKNCYKKNRVTSVFGSNREKMKIKGYTWHEGVDFSGMKGTRLDIVDLFSGVIVREAFNKIYGNYVEIKHNPKFIGGANELFYSRYCHLNKIEKGLSNSFIVYGTKLGIMGDTGHSYGVHLHLDVRQKGVEKYKKTKLLIDMQDKLKFEDDVINFNWQFGNLYINPFLMMDYFKLLQKGKK